MEKNETTMVVKNFVFNNIKHAYKLVEKVTESGDKVATRANFIVLSVHDAETKEIAEFLYSYKDFADAIGSANKFLYRHPEIVSNGQYVDDIADILEGAIFAINRTPYAADEIYVRDGKEYACKKDGVRHSIVGVVLADDAVDAIVALRRYLRG